MAIAKSSYEIELVNMQDSLVILELEKKEIEKTNEEYEDKLALIAQEVERLRNQLDNTRRENEQLKKKVVEQADILLKFDLENKELRGSMERMRMESRELRVVNDNQTLQLKEYY
jgi:septal ring factor EnvC (AmiA/AmiB activator)